MNYFKPDLDAIKKNIKVRILVGGFSGQVGVLGKPFGKSGLFHVYVGEDERLILTKDEFLLL
jgi:hypothetical protein